MSPEQLAAASQAQAAWVQAKAAIWAAVAATLAVITTIIYIILTNKYVRLTKEIINAPFKTFLQPYRAVRTNNLLIVVKNEGKEIARSVELKLLKQDGTVSKARYMPGIYSPAVLSYLYTNAKDYEPMINAAEEKMFIFEDLGYNSDLTLLTCEFIIGWRTLLNETQEEKWRLEEDDTFTDIG